MRCVQGRIYSKPGPVRNKKLSYRLENRASATYFFVAKLISIAHSCL